MLIIINVVIRKNMFVHQILFPSSCDNDTHSSVIISCVKYYIVILLSDVNKCCLLYTSDAADDTPCVDLGGRRIIKKK